MNGTDGNPGADGAGGEGQGLALATAVPEPATGVLVVLGMLVLARIRRRAAFSA